MPREVLLHVGMHKTGTTALQHALHGYDDGQLRHAALGHVNHSIPLMTAFVAQPQNYHVWRDAGFSAERIAAERAAYRQRIVTELAQPHPRLTMIGEEVAMLATAPAGEMLAMLQGSGTAAARRVRVVAYLRDPAGFMISAFAQQVRGGRADPVLPRPNYEARFGKFITLLGRDAVVFRDYQPLAGQSVIADFAGLAGITPGALQDRRANPSLPMDVVRLLHLFNRTAPRPQGLHARAARSAMIRHLATRFTGRFTLPPEVVAAACDVHDFDWVERAAGFSLGPRPEGLGRTAGAHDARAALIHHMTSIPETAMETLRVTLTQRHLPHDRRDDAAVLLSKLYASFLAEGAETGQRAVS